MDGLEWAWIDTYDLTYNIFYSVANLVGAASTNPVARSYQRP